MKTIETVKAEIQNEINLTLDFFAELDKKEEERKALENRLENTPEQRAELERLFNELTELN